MWSVIREGIGGPNFLVGGGGGGDIQQKGEVQTFEFAWGGPSPYSSVNGTFWSSKNKNPEDSAWSSNCNVFEKSE